MMTILKIRHWVVFVVVLLVGGRIGIDFTENYVNLGVEGASASKGGEAKVNSKIEPSVCEKQCHVGFNAQQRQQLCQGIPTKSIGPAVCSALAKSELHLQFDKILALCIKAVNAAPAQCYQGLPSKHRNTVGIALCTQAKSEFLATCFSQLSAIRGFKNDSAVVEFCRQHATDDNIAPLSCVTAAVSDLGIPATQALSLCNNAVSAANTQNCINDLHHSSSASIAGLKPSEIVALCASSPDAPEELPISSFASIVTEDSVQGILSPVGRCMLAVFNVSTRDGTLYASNALSISQRQQLCTGAPADGLGPTVCALHAHINQKTQSLGLKGDDVVSLCTGAVSAGPVNCFSESRGMGSTSQRIELCQGASGAGVMHCYRKSAKPFRNDHVWQQQLCIGAESDDPATCAVQAPVYLSELEKVKLCANSPLSQGTAPVRCLQSVEKTLKLFSDSPRRVLGFDHQSISQPNELRIREAVISMCSFASSRSPLASGECLKAAPSSQSLAVAISICTDVSSAAVIAHVAHCARVLPPNEWPRDIVAQMCKDTESTAAAQGVVHCALSLSKPLSNGHKMSQDEVAALCSTESVENHVVSCVKAASQAGSRSYSSAHLLDIPVVSAVCSNAISDAPGQCLALLAAKSAQQQVVDADMVKKICRLANSVNPKQLVSCLDSQRSNGKIKNVRDVENCLSQPRVPHSVRVVRLLSEDNDIHATAGKRFSLWLQLYDQWDQPMTADLARSGGNRPGWFMSASINENNHQGAVLWGTRSNYSVNGLLQLNSLIVSQPGPLELKIWYFNTTTGNEITASSSQKVSLALFKIVVLENPDVAATEGCTFIFREASCSSYVSEAEWTGYFPRITGTFGSRYYARLWSCASVFETWNVSLREGSELGNDWVEYRHGIDAVWTGIEFPSVEMSLLERLGIEHRALPSEDDISASNLPLLTMKELKRAYYKKSLLWHPDRWSGMPMYTIPVQGAFELISDAYNALVMVLKGAGGSKSSIQTEDDATD